MHRNREEKSGKRFQEGKDEEKHEPRQLCKTDKQREREDVEVGWG